MVELRVLGTVEARLDGTEIDLGPPRARCVLVALLADAGEAVPTDQLVARVWGDRAPYRVGSTLRSYLSRLRHALAPTGGVEIVRRSGGYAITVDPDSVDLHRFRELVAKARAAGDDASALALFDRAVRLWRGEAFAGLDSPWLNGLRDTVEAERQEAELDLTDLRLRRGEHGALVPELATRVGARPWDERLAGQYMLALYRSGRQADALTHYRELRTRLAEELGADPGPALRELHQRILTSEAALPTTTALPVPRQLPSAPGPFAGRQDELAALDAALAPARGTAVITAIAGTGGIGKTWLALHWAHEHLDRFPDGQLFVDLRGFTPAGRPVPPDAAVRGFLAALGVEKDRVPPETDAQATLYRSLVAGRRMLIVLDNAHDTTQVIPLLPGSPTCTVLITSRDHLAGLVATHSAVPLALSTLDPPDARDLLARRLGQARLDAEPDAVDELLDRCAGLPLALSVAAARVAAHPGHTVATLAAELRDSATRLGALDTGDPVANLSAVLSWSYDALDPEHRAAFARLGGAPGRDLNLNAAASLTGLPAPHAHAVLRTLTRVSLVDEHVPGRWRMHDLVKLYATTLPDLPEDGLRRLVDYYLHTAHTGDRVLAPYDLPEELSPPVRGSLPEELADRAVSVAWFAAEHANLLATQHAVAERGWHTATRQFARVLSGYHFHRGDGHDEVVVWQTAARRAGDPATRILAGRRLGRAYALLCQHEEAVRHLGEALALAERTGDRHGQAATHHSLAWSREQLGEYGPARRHATNALRLFRELSMPTKEADALNMVGWLSAQLGDYADARAHCGAALSLCREHSYHTGEAATLDSFGYLAHLTGDHAEAVSYYTQALKVCRDFDVPYYEADTLERLGDTHVAAGHADEAAQAWRDAVELYTAQNRAEKADHLRRRLRGLDHADR